MLLLEAGGTNIDPDHQTYGERHWTLATAPGYNWGYKTVPQVQLDREIDQSRGKGLGGSSAINFCVYTRGPRADYDHWAEQVGDDTWCWESVQERFKEVNAYSSFGKYWSATKKNVLRLKLSKYHQKNSINGSILHDLHMAIMGKRCPVLGAIS